MAGEVGLEKFFRLFAVFCVTRGAALHGMQFEMAVLFVFGHNQSRLSKCTREFAL